MRVAHMVMPWHQALDGSVQREPAITYFHRAGYRDGCRAARSAIRPWDGRRLLAATTVTEAKVPGRIFLKQQASSSNFGLNNY